MSGLKSVIQWIRGYASIFSEAFLDYSGGAGDSCEKFIRGFRWLHCQVGQSFQDELFIRLDCVFLLENILEIQPQGLVVFLIVPVHH